MTKEKTSTEIGIEDLKKSFKESDVFSIIIDTLYVWLAERFIKVILNNFCKKLRSKLINEEDIVVLENMMKQEGLK